VIFLLLQSQRKSANLHWGKRRVGNSVFGWHLSTDCTRTANCGREIAFHARNDFFNVGDERAPSLRQRYKMMISVENFKADVFFVFADLAADGWLRDVQPLSGFAEVQVASDSNHVLELPKRWERIHGNRLRGTSAYLHWTLLRLKSCYLSFFQMFGDNLIADGGKYFAGFGHQVAWLPDDSTLLSGGTKPISIKSSSPLRLRLVPDDLGM
jgi:hypothetical protein